MKAILTLLLLAGISVGVFALGYIRKGDGEKQLLNVASEVALTVNVTKPERGEIVRLVQAPGDVEAVLEVEVSSELVAKIEEMPVEEGDVVKKGDLLCRLDNRYLLAEMESAEARIAQLQSAITQAQTDLEKAERDLGRQISLSEADATSDLELRDYKTVRDKSRSLLDQRRHEQAQAEAALKRIREDLEKTVIRSPIDGVISKLSAKQGEVVVTGTMNNPGTVIMTISDLSRMQVRARVDEIDVPLVKADQPARLYLQADPDNPVPAKVVRVASKGTKPQGRDVVTFETMLEVLSNDPRIKPAMTANVEIEVARNAEALTVPVEAVVHRMRKELPDSIVAEFDRRQGGLALSERARQAQYLKVVYVMNDDVAHVRLVEPGIADTRRVEIASGIEPSDTVIVGPYRSLDQLKDGKKVALSEEEKKKQQKDKDAEKAAEEKTAGTPATDDKANDDGAAGDSQSNEQTASTKKP
jgi:HlyD family secretion protein